METLTAECGSTPMRVAVLTLGALPWYQGKADSSALQLSSRRTRCISFANWGQH